MFGWHIFPSSALTVINGSQAVTIGVGSLLLPGIASPSGSGSLPFCEVSSAVPVVVELAITELL